MLVDEINLTVSAGHGGPGRVSFRHAGRGPDGGNGGKGGNVIFQTTTDLYALNRYTSQKHYLAQNGFPGANRFRTGAMGQDLILTLDTHEVFNLNQNPQSLLVCEGGKGGLGNNRLKSSFNTTPKFAQSGLDGQKRRLKCVLKLIADFGLIGLPNAGKSSLLNVLTSAHAKVAAYPFTTLEPNLGVCKNKIIADIPGLIAGASTGKGLGDKFLQHLEKIPVLLHILSADSPQPLIDYQTIRQELAQYNPDLITKTEVLIITKSDLVTPSQITTLKRQFGKIISPVFVVSVLKNTSIQTLKSFLIQ
jgi:GTP-binding protein